MFVYFLICYIRVPTIIASARQKHNGCLPIITLSERLFCLKETVENEVLILSRKKTLNKEMEIGVFQGLVDLLSLQERDYCMQVQC